MGFLKEPSHLILILIIILLLFGSTRLPDAARGIGRSLRIFKSEIKQMQDDDKPRATNNEPAGPLEGRVVQPGQQARADERTGETPRNL
jgi:sec-independent protein translocase protein TatA